MWIKGRIAAIGVGIGLCALAGCKIEENGVTDPECGCSTESNNPEADQYCVPFCDHLEACGLVSIDAGAACLSFCEDQYAADPNGTQNGCQCAVNQGCESASDYLYSCPEAPVPPAGLVGTSGNASGSSTGSTTGESWGTTGSTWGTATTTTGTVGTTTGTVGATITTGGNGGTSGTTGAATTSTSSSSSSSSGGTTGGGTACTENINCADDQDCVNGSCLQRCSASCECATGQSCVGNYCYSSVPPPASCTVDCECNAGQTCVNNTCQ